LIVAASAYSNCENALVGSRSMKQNQHKVLLAALVR
jgi:hypothetical protein